MIILLIIDLHRQKKEFKNDRVKKRAMNILHIHLNLLDIKNYMYTVRTNKSYIFLTMIIIKSVAALQPVKENKGFTYRV